MREEVYEILPFILTLSNDTFESQVNMFDKSKNF